MGTSHTTKTPTTHQFCLDSRELCSTYPAHFSSFQKPCPRSHRLSLSPLTGQARPAPNTPSPHLYDLQLAQPSSPRRNAIRTLSSSRRVSFALKRLHHGTDAIRAGSRKGTDSTVLLNASLPVLSQSTGEKCPSKTR